MAYKVFLSHSSVDTGWVRWIATNAQQVGIEAGWRRRCFLTSAICRRQVSPSVVRRCPGHLPGSFGISQTPDYGVCASHQIVSRRGYSLGYRLCGVLK
jgi:hypothetical protein